MTNKKTLMHKFEPSFLISLVQYNLKPVLDLSSEQLFKLEFLVIN